MALHGHHEIFLDALVRHVQKTLREEDVSDADLPSCTAARLEVIAMKLARGSHITPPLQKG
jgi:hypothetical protein